MSEVNRYDIAEYGGGMDVIVDGTYVGADDFDRVTAERDAALAEVLRVKQQSALRLIGLANCGVKREALQQRLTAADERADMLEGLIGEVLDAVGREPLDLDAVLRLRARMRAALKPAEAKKTDPRVIDALREAGYLRND